MTRRELLRLLSMAGVLLGESSLDSLDWDRIGDAARSDGVMDNGVLDQYEALNAHLWRAFASAARKASVAPLVDQHLASLTGALRTVPRSQYRRRLCAATADVLQLRGEIAFDANQYDGAAHCYSLAATAGREAGDFDLWACAMTRYAYVSVYEQSYSAAGDMLELAGCLARNGDPALSTRYWVESVRAQALAGRGHFEDSQRALDAADAVRSLAEPVHNGGWLRFDGSRLGEERATCYVKLRRPDLAEPLLREVLNLRLSPRRRGSVLVDLALTGIQRGDVTQTVFYGAAALDVERQSRSGVLGKRLATLYRNLDSLGDDRHVVHLRQQMSLRERSQPDDRE